MAGLLKMIGIHLDEERRKEGQIYLLG